MINHGNAASLGLIEALPIYVARRVVFAQVPHACEAHLQAPLPFLDGVQTS
jgi:hypothetical protein